jgi:RPA family protein
MTTKIPKGRASDGKVNISLNPETVAMLAEVKDEMSKTLGFNLSYSQAIQHLVKFYQSSDFYKQRDKVSE